MAQVSNAIKYPEQWEYFVQEARNNEDTPLSTHKYSIPHPSGSGKIIYSDDPGRLFIAVLREWDGLGLQSLSTEHIML